MSNLSYTYILTNGTTADANEVMGNFNSVAAVLNGDVDTTNINLAIAPVWTGIHTFGAGNLKIKGAGSGLAVLQYTNTPFSRTYTFVDSEANDNIVTQRFLSPGAYRLKFAQGSDASQLLLTGEGGSLFTDSPAWITIRRLDGTFITHSLTGDVTIDLTGAHWGLDGKGDVTGAILRVYAIDDNGTLKFGVGYQGGFTYIRNTQDDVTAANINLPEEILVDTNITTDNSAMLDIGYIIANFTDATNEWAITRYCAGLSADGLWQPWNTTFSGFSVNPSNFNSLWSQIGKTIFINFSNTTDGTSNSTAFTLTGPIKCANSHISWPARITNNGVVSSTPGIVEANAASATFQLYTSYALQAWTNVNAKNARFQGSYEAYQP